MKLTTNNYKVEKLNKNNVKITDIENKRFIHMQTQHFENILKMIFDSRCDNYIECFMVDDLNNSTS